MDVAAAVQQVARHMPVLADRLTMAVERWSRTGQLFANARDLPRMEAMPQDRIEAVIAGRHVRASGADLDGLRQVVGRAADLSTGLADVLHRAAGTGPRAQQHRTDRSPWAHPPFPVAGGWLGRDGRFQGGQGAGA